MVEFKWIITDKYIDRKGNEHYTNDEFPYADGYFEMTLNQQRWGVFPKIAENWNGTFVRNFPDGGDSLMELFQCFSSTLRLNPYQTFIFKPMDLPLINLLFFRNNNILQISQQPNEEKISKILSRKPQWRPPVHWTETVSFDEFCNVVSDNIKQFLKVIGEENPALLENKYVKELTLV